MTEIRFYHLTRKSLEAALPELLSKAYGRGSRTVVRTSSTQQTEQINDLLWKYHPNSFLPHGSRSDGNAEMQPVWITEEEDNPNNAEMLFIIGTASDINIDSYNLVCFLFDGHDEEAVAASRRRWITYKESGHDLAYWQQTDKGWEKK